MTTHTPTRLSMPGPATMSLRSVSKPSSSVTGSPTATTSRASSPLAAPMSIHRSLISGTVLRSSCGKEVDRLASDDADDGALRRPDVKLLTDEHLRVPAADGRHADKTLVVDVLDHQPDLVAVTGQHDSGAAIRVDGGDHVAVPVGGDAGGERFNEFPHDVLNGPLVAGRAGRVEEGFEKLERRLIHDDSCGTLGSRIIVTENRTGENSTNETIRFDGRGSA